MNPERFKSDKVVARDPDGYEIELPLVFYRNFQAADKLSLAFERKYLKRFEGDGKKKLFMRERAVSIPRNLKGKEFIDNSMLIFNCHIFFLRALGFKIELKKIYDNINSYTFEIFEESDYVELDNPVSLKNHVDQMFESLQTNLIACQIRGNRNQLSHSLFFMKYRSGILCFEKLGPGGLFYTSFIEDAFDDKYFAEYDSYGKKFAFADWYEIATNPDLHKKFEEKYGK